MAGSIALAAVAPLYLYAFLQLGAAAVLLNRRAGPVLAYRLMGALFLLNTGITIISALEVAGLPGASTYPILQLLRYAMDVPTAPLLIAFLLARTEDGARRHKRWIHALLGIAAIHALLALTILDSDPDPNLVSIDSTLDLLTRAFPFYASLGVLTVVLARGATWERWIALAFLPRALYFGVIGLNRLGPAFNGVAAAWELPNAIALGLLLVVAGYASARLLFGRHPPTSMIVLSMLALGPLLAGVEIATVAAPIGLFWPLNLITLALIRPPLVVAGVVRDQLRPMMLAAIVAAATSSVALLALLATSTMGDAADVVLAMGAGLLAMAAAESSQFSRAEVLDALVEGAPSQAELNVGAAARVSAEAPVETPSPRPGPGATAVRRRPAWQSILLELQGSSDEDPSRRVPARFTQKAIAERTGLSIKRVSEFPEQLNATARQRLDAFLPGWTPMSGASAAAGNPLLVKALKGSAEGAQGVWVYYRLTPLGERLAAAVAAADLEKERADEASSTLQHEPSRRTTP